MKIVHESESESGRCLQSKAVGEKGHSTRKTSMNRGAEEITKGRKQRRDTHLLSSSAGKTNERRDENSMNLQELKLNAAPLALTSGSDKDLDPVVIHVSLTNTTPSSLTATADGTFKLSFFEFPFRLQSHLLLHSFPTCKQRLHLPHAAHLYGGCPHSHTSTVPLAVKANPRGLSELTISCCPFHLPVPAGTSHQDDTHRSGSCPNLTLTLLHLTLRS